MAKEPKELKKEKLAVIITGGKQYLVHSGAKIKIEKLLGEAGSAVTFDQVVMTSTGDDLKLGTPLLSGVTVTGKITRHGRREKVYGAKVKPKKRYKKYFGHKQHFTEVAID